jgi:hypothetical protein
MSGVLGFATNARRKALRELPRDVEVIAFYKKLAAAEALPMR